MYSPNNFYTRGESELNEINKKIKGLENESHYIELKKKVELKTDLVSKELTKQKTLVKYAPIFD